jgi:hypothetical protein
MRLAASAWGSLALAALAAGCGAGELEPQEYPAAAEQLVSRREIDRFAPGTPARALLSWWRSSQYADRGDYVAGFARPVRERVERRDVVREVTVFAGGIRTAKPEIVATEIAGDEATVFTLVRFRTPVGSTRFVTTTRRQAFDLIREGGDWRLADDFFVRSIVGPSAGR